MTDIDIAGVVEILQDVPPGAWTVAVAVLAFLFMWARGRAARAERDDDRAEREEMRAAELERERLRDKRETEGVWRAEKVAKCAQLVEHLQTTGPELMSVRKGEWERALDRLVAASDRHTQIFSLYTWISLFAEPPLRKAGREALHAHAVLLEEANEALRTSLRPPEDWPALKTFNNTVTALTLEVRRDLGVEGATSPTPGPKDP
ncbi:hypothetical protein JQN72_10200 [Phycicoccus sp. CSK15P-2]|uniref:hypothetical protein n=1 Tax=Phycicoccus sp. CSK15P-2 TaxID=2807627 RepID=UPI00194FE09F|nr:hypothetical protein [Phycicoccus sp. CSK15P-2]MBM6404611.1 hypothetical protein [Phycicoccus sp. CSK15P-2]